MKTIDNAKPRKLLLVLLILICSSGMFAQGITYEFAYDQAGNRIMRKVVDLGMFANDGREAGQTLGLPDTLGKGLVMTLFPNPTRETVRFEAADGQTVDSYSLYSPEGRLIEKKSVGGASLAVDLSGQPAGFYLVELVVDRKKHIYKIIKR